MIIGSLVEHINLGLYIGPQVHFLTPALRMLQGTLKVVHGISHWAVGYLCCKALSFLIMTTESLGVGSNMLPDYPVSEIYLSYYRTIKNS